MQTIKKCYDLHEGIICMCYNLRGVMQVFYVGYNLHCLLIHGCKPYKKGIICICYDLHCKLRIHANNQNDLHEGIICMCYNLQGFMQVFYLGYNLHYLLIHMDANHQKMVSFAYVMICILCKISTDS